MRTGTVWVLITGAVLILGLGIASGLDYLTNPKEKERRTHGPGSAEQRCKEASQEQGYDNYYLVRASRFRPAECLVTQPNGEITNLWR